MYVYNYVCVFMCVYVCVYVGVGAIVYLFVCMCIPFIY